MVLESRVVRPEQEVRVDEYGSGTLLTPAGQLVPPDSSRSSAVATSVTSIFGRPVCKTVGRYSSSEPAPLVAPNAALTRSFTIRETDFPSRRASFFR